MQITPPVKLEVRTATAPPRWELAVRYGAAYACTLVAIAAAQLRIPNSFALLLTGITLLGLPISLYLRWSGLRIGSYYIRRPLINSAVVILTVAATIYRFNDIPQILSRAFTTDFYQFLLRYSTEYPFELLMQVFLLFAVCRCLAIINDNDAVLCALPSFSVLLLLIVVHKGPQVVAYFLLWAVISAVLFAMDHRAEARHGVVGRLPSVVPGQDIKLSARSLAAVMGFSLLCALLLSYSVASREADERGKAESWMTSLASRLTRLALNLPDATINAGPERQIDFTAAPSLPSRRPLWQVHAMTDQGRVLHPNYWRLFTLARYDGSTWSQLPRAKDEEVRRSELPKTTTPVFGTGSYLADPRYLQNYGRNEPILLGYKIPLQQGRPEKGSVTRGHGQANSNHRFGTPPLVVRQTILARYLSYGFVPLLPEARLLHIFYNSADITSPDHIFVRHDNSAEIGVLDRGGGLEAVSQVPPGAEYGGPHGGPPLFRGQGPNPQVYLTDAERKTYLELPATLPPGCRVRALAKRETRKADAHGSDYARAQRLELYVRGIGNYTLHPPEIPVGQDAADYFLFKSRRGYCTYYAGALTVLCRAAGIPARVVSGFVNPEWEAHFNAGTIYESNAHAWTEVWVPNWGWATLDATPNDDRGNNAPNWWDNLLEIGNGLVSNNWQRLRHNAVGLSLVGFSVLSAILLVVARRQGFGGQVLTLGWLRWGHPHLSDDVMRRVILTSYNHAAKKLTRRFRPRAPWETPAEWLQAAEAALDLHNPEPLRQLTNLYAQAKYSPEPLEDHSEAVAHTALTNLSWQRRRV